jgi:EAL and modified HD-GYP domain-containing signal transduction protein
MLMSAPDTQQFPLVQLQAIADARQAWVALSVRPLAWQASLADALHLLYDTPALLAARAPLDCVLRLAAPEALSEALLALMPPNRVVLAFDAAGLADPAAAKRAVALQESGYRILVDVADPDAEAQDAATPLPLSLRARARDCGAAAPKANALATLFGPHLAYHVDSAVRLDACVLAGFGWFSGDYARHPAPSATPDDGTSRKRLLALLGLLSRDADVRELEGVLKQDPALAFQLLKVVNSAAFALSQPISGFVHAINVLGRRQLQRWLQLLLYARKDDDGRANALLPVAARRAARMEALCKAGGGDRDAQDRAFMAGVFSLLDVLLATPMDEIVGALSLPADVDAAFRARDGALGTLLRLAEQESADAALIADAGIDTGTWWTIELAACRWAIQVSRNV